MQKRTFAVSLAAFAVVLLGAACGDDDDTAPSTSTSRTTSASGTAVPTASGVARPSDEPPELSVERIATGLARPTFVTNAGDGSNRLFALEKPGRIRIIKNGSLLPAAFLDITSLVGSSGNEQGLLGLAFHPDFESNGRFFVAYTAKNAENTVAECISPCLRRTQLPSKRTARS